MVHSVLDPFRESSDIGTGLYSLPVKFGFEVFDVALPAVVSEGLCGHIGCGYCFKYLLSNVSECVSLSEDVVLLCPESPVTNASSEEDGRQ